MRKDMKRLDKALAIVAAALGRKFGVRVFVCGHQAKTDGNVITIPSHDPNNPDFKNLAWGYLAHESAHIRYTDFSVDWSGPAIRKQLLNVVEDIRIEEALVQDYPGMHKYLDLVSRTLLSQGMLEAPAAGEHPAAILQGYMLLSLYRDVRDQSYLDANARKAEQALRATFPLGAVVRLKGLLAQVRHLDSTASALSLVDRILTMLKDEQERAGEKGQKPCQEGSPQESDDALGGDDDSVEEQESDGGDGTTGSAGEPDGTDPANSSGAGTGDEEAGAQADAGKVAAIQQALDAAGSETAQGMAERAAEALSSAEVDRTDPMAGRDLTVPEAVTASCSPFIASVKEAQDQSKRLRSDLIGLVQSHQERRPRTRSRGRRLDRHRLTRIAMGNPRVFVHRDQQEWPNTALHLLVDASSSMGDAVDDHVDRHELAMQSVIALGLALETIDGVSPAVTEFPDRSDSGRVTEVIRHGESVRMNLSRFGGYSRGLTPMADALMHSGYVLAHQKEERKVVFVLTDGDPDCKTEAKYAISLLEKAGVEVIGIGMGTMAVTNLFSQWFVVQDFHDLRKGLFEITRKTLLAA